MNDLLEKAKREYPIGTKFKSMKDGTEHTITRNTFEHYGNVYVFDEEWDIRCIYDINQNKWAEIIKEETMTQQEFNSLRVGDTLGEWEILHKFKELLIIEDKRGYDLVDLEKINKLGLKVTPKKFMGLEIKEYDNVPCEINDKLYYLIEVKENSILVTSQKNSIYPYSATPTSIKLL